ncbi:hypothetical protein HG535_0H02570 [Zygotorulaspora mrakii]|uniref:Protein HIR n=1 Tax=Zygotorulaspora mrakii TaxID=42260 RepID=A0A7H9B903_ZYGMR|nr:uncharacterized protein HG535_0H02570 [Zygotorulaspora mrakii]QLG74930.1 hypothetical protein HG535_0H02570 [Zygotorulaspora mrakii]
MKLLKYPLAEHDRGVNALAAIGSWLLLADIDGHVQVWSQARLVEAAFNGSKIKNLCMEYSLAMTNTGSPEDRNIFFLLGDEQKLFVGTEQRLFCYRRWLEKDKVEISQIFDCKPPSTITDVKYDSVNDVLFILQSKVNCILILNAGSMKRLAKISLSDTMAPITGVIDPMGQIFSVMVSDRSVLVYQYNAKGSFKLHQKLGQSVDINPLHYNITMSPQADVLPVINSLKGSSTTTSTSILLLDRNDNYKTSTTLVSIPSNKCKVLKFSPVIYEKTNAKKGIKTRYNLLATSGSKDGTVVVWNTKRVKPLFNAIRVSETPIIDMAWSCDGLKLFVISNDNVLYNFAFQENDLGDVLDDKEMKSLRANNQKLMPLPEAEEKPEETTVKLEKDKSLSLLDTDNVKTTTGKKVTKKKLPSDLLKTTQSTTMEFNGPSYNVPKDLKRKPKTDLSKEVNGNKKMKKDLEPMDFLDTGLLLPMVSFSKIRLASPKVRLNFKYSPPSKGNLVFDIKNGSGNEQKPTIFTLTSKIEEQEKILFQDFLPKFINICTGGDSFWACSSTDGFIYVYSDSGKKIMPPLCLGVPCSFLEACGSHLLCITSAGQMYCWDMFAKKLLFPINTVYPLLDPSLRYTDDILTRAENITMCAVTQRGVPLITLSNGNGYMFDKDMETWLLISDGWWAYGSQYWDMTNISSLSLNGGNDEEKRNKGWKSGDAQMLTSKIIQNKESIVNYIERKTNDELSRKGRIKNLQRFARTILMKEGYENLEEIVTLSHLENRLLVTLRLDDCEEFSNILSVYCIRLSELGYSDRLDDVLQWLYNNGNMDGSIAGNSRRDLLQSVLMHCSNFRHVQRVTTSYASALGWYNNE